MKSPLSVSIIAHSACIQPFRGALYGCDPFVVNRHAHRAQGGRERLRSTWLDVAGGSGCVSEEFGGHVRHWPLEVARQDPLTGGGELVDFALGAGARYGFLAMGDEV